MSGGNLSSTQTTLSPMLKLLMITPLFNERLAELFDPVQTFFDVRHAGRVAQADVIVRPERDTRNSGDFFLLQQFGTELGGFQAGFGDVREQVKRALGIHAGEAGNGIQLRVRVAAALVVFREPDWQMFL